MSIALVTADTSHPSPTTVRDYLVGRDYSVTMWAEGSVDATNLDGYDNIIALRLSLNQATLASHLMGYIAKGKWVCCGGTAGTTAGTYSGSIPELMGMAPSENTLESDESALQTVRMAHPITGNRDVGATFQWLSATDYSYDIEFYSTKGLRLSSLDRRPQHSAIHLFSSGDLGITATSPGGCGIYFGCLYNRNAFGTDAGPIMDAILAARPAVMSGTVIGDDGSPAQRTIRAYLRDSGGLSAETQSDPGDGTFTLDTWVGEKHTVIALDDEAGDKNALVFDRITPVAP